MGWLILAVIVLAVLAHHHGRHYQAGRSHGLTVSESMRGPFGRGSRIRISKRF
jgi:hypothetical protein